MFRAILCATCLLFSSLSLAASESAVNAKCTCAACGHEKTCENNANCKCASGEKSCKETDKNCCGGHCDCKQK